VQAEISEFNRAQKGVPSMPFRTIHAKFLLVAFGLTSPVVAQDQTTPERISADTFLPGQQKRNSEPGVLRIYKLDDDGNIVSTPGFPKTITDPTSFNPDTDLARDERTRMHEGTDYSSHGTWSDDLKPLDFKAGVHGRVDIAKPGMVTVEVDSNKNRVEYLHNSKVYVKPGQVVTPNTVLGTTGNLDPKSGKPIAKMGIHLHVQAKNRLGSALNPDQVVAYARKPLVERDPLIPFFVPMKWVDVKPVLSADDFRESVFGKSTFGYDANAKKSADSGNVSGTDWHFQYRGGETSKSVVRFNEDGRYGYADFGTFFELENPRWRWEQTGNRIQIRTVGTNDVNYLILEGDYLYLSDQTGAKGEANFIRKK
jgi:hypothetical protein